MGGGLPGEVRFVSTAASLRSPACASDGDCSGHGICAEKSTASSSGEEANGNECYCVYPFIGRSCGHRMLMKRALPHGFQVRNLDQRRGLPDWHTFCAEGWRH